MEVNKRFMEMLTAIDFHVGHLPKDLWVNEEQVPELQPVFELLVHKLSPKTNCVTPKELALYAALSSKHNQFSSLNNVSKGIEKFYDENTKDTILRTSDLQELERKINDSEKELHSLKKSRDSYDKQKCAANNEITLLKTVERNINLSTFKIQDNLTCVMKMFLDVMDEYQFNFNKLHNDVTCSMKNEEISFTKLSSIELIKLTELWRKQILTLINKWFGPEKKHSDIGDLFSNQIHKLSVVSQSITELRMRDIKERCEISKINMALNDIYSVKNDFESTRDNIYLNGVALKKYIINKFMIQREVNLDADLHMTTEESNDLQQRTSNLVVTDAQRKILDLETIENRIGFIHDSMEHYIMVCDSLWCLMRTGCSMANLKCELLLHCISVIKMIFEDIKRSERWNINYEEDENAPQSIPTSTRVVKFEGYKCFSEAYKNCDEMEKLTAVVSQMKDKFNYKKNDEDILFFNEKLEQFSNALRLIHDKFPNLST